MPRRGSRAQPLPEFRTAAFELVEGPVEAAGRRLQIDIEEDDEIGHAPCGGHAADAADVVGIEAAGMPLVDDVGQQVAVGYDPVAPREGRADDLGDKLRRAAM